MLILRVFYIMYRELVEVVNKVYMWISLSMYMSERRKRNKRKGNDMSVYIYMIKYVTLYVMKLLKYVCITSSLTICHSYSYIHTTPAALSHTTPAALSHTTPAALSHTMIMFVT